MLYRSTLIGRLLLILSTSLTGAGVAQADDAEAPKVQSNGDRVWKRLKPEMYKAGWVDFDKDNRQSPFEDPRLPIEDRVTDLLGRMTQAEKLGQTWQRPMRKESDLDDQKALAAGEIGSYLGIDGNGPGLRNSLQRIAVEESRLGVPLVFGFDTIHGLRTVFPIPLAMSCAWDPAMIEKTNAIAARESKAVGVDWAFAPMVDIARDPRWGRIAEGFGEDPYLGGVLAAGAVRGYQGDDPSKPDRVAACLKHYVGYGAAEGGRDYNTTEIGLPTLRNIYLAPFKAGVDAGALSLMSAFNCLNGVPASGNHFTLTEVLRNEWRFSGMVVSDFDSVKELMDHGYATDRADAARLGMTAGVEMEMVSDTYVRNIDALIRKGAVKQATLDQAVRRILRFKYRCGLFSKPYAEGVQNPFLSPDGIALAREAAVRSAVLVKNDNGILPLKPGARIALIGPYGGSDDLLGCWGGIGRPEEVVTLEKGLRDAVGADRMIVVRGCDLQETKESDLDAAVAAAGQADVVVLAVGEPTRLSGEANSRQTLNLPGLQEQLAARIAATGKPVVTVLISGRPLAVPTLRDQSTALLIAWHGGVQAGNAIADILTGKEEPTGRLTATWVRAVGQIPLHYNGLPTGRGFVNSFASHYRDGPRDPLLPFGFGLGYSTFTVGKVALERQQAPLKEAIAASALVTNTGDRRGTTVVQWYIRDHAAVGGARPLRELRGFERVTLDPGESRTVSFVLNVQSLGYWLSDGAWGVEPGDFSVWAGLDSATQNQADFRME